MKIEVKYSVKPVDYMKSMQILEKRVQDVFLGKKVELLWILEHNSVYTGGTSSSQVDILDKNLKVIKTNRGGKITYHGPGQKVAYFVLNLNNREKNIRKLVKKIERCIISVLDEYGIKAYADRKNIGIWIGKEKPKKVAAIGVKVKKWIAYHGFSLNISNDLLKYKKINPCGIQDKEMTNLKEIKKDNYNNISKIITKKFLNIFL
tara:strand:- start:1905 stop:2519 length:615 start_codon:yes stop_codon:yes gene_type:complete